MRIAMISLVVMCSAVCLAAPKPPSLLSADDPLPDPLVMKDGTRVTTPAQWKMRRKEMLKLTFRVLRLIYLRIFVCRLVAG